jgi:short-subunit dehydrogenase
MKTETVLITGASSGIGKATALLLKQQGYNVYATARRVEKMDDLKAQGINILPIDVTNEQSMGNAVAAIYKEAGSIDVLINNAGYGSYGSLEDVTMEEARYQVEVNVFGLARLTQLVLPAMREARHGTIVNISSVGGTSGEPLGSWYHATKYAVEGLTDSLSLELRPFGIKVFVVQPGPIITEWGPIAAENILKVSGHTDPSFGSDPKVIAETILKGLKAKHPKMRYASGNGAKLGMFLRKHLSDKLWYRLGEMMMDRLVN